MCYVLLYLVISIHWWIIHEAVSDICSFRSFVRGIFLKIVWTTTRILVHVWHSEVNLLKVLLWIQGYWFFFREIELVTKSFSLLECFDRILFKDFFMCSFFVNISWNQIDQVTALCFKSLFRHFEPFWHTNAYRVSYFSKMHFKQKQITLRVKFFRAMTSVLLKFRL